MEVWQRVKHVTLTEVEPWQRNTTPLSQLNTEPWQLRETSAVVEPWQRYYLHAGDGEVWQRRVIS